MKLFFLISFIVLITTFTGCKAIRKITSKDESTATATSTKKPDRQVKFIDGIEVTPGNKVISKHKTASHKVPVTSNYTIPANTTANSFIEKADWLQLKYAVLMDAEVEMLTNVPLLRKMEEWWGTKYCMGGDSKNCIDCSAFTGHIMEDIYHVKLPRTAQEQYNVCDKIDQSELKEGDLVFFHTGGKRSKSITHVGVYIANNRFANASTNGGVTISDLNDPYWKKRFKAAGRVIGKQ